MMEVLLDQDIHINALVIIFTFYLLFIQIQIILECLMIVHRRCRAKVGNYCGCKGNTLQLYEKWKENVGSFFILKKWNSFI